MNIFCPYIMMKNKITFLFILTFCLGCRQENTVQKEQGKQIEVQFNRNIHTAQIIELLVWDCESPTRPVMVMAQKQFEAYRDHPAVKLSDSLLLNDIFYFDELVEILLYMEEFPSTQFRYSLKNAPYYANRTDIIDKWVKLIADFYVDADVESFLNENKEFYRGAKQEVIKNLPPQDFVSQIESYYRDSQLSYSVIPCPEMCPGGGIYGHRGYGPYVYTDDGIHVFQVISACQPSEIDSITNNFTGYGFDNKDYILRQSYHEFGHSFVNPLLEKEANTILIDQYRHLFTPELKEALPNQVGTWFDCMAEHMVRLGEIRLAERSGDFFWAAELRSYHINDENFIFLPDLEEKIKEYEKDDNIKSYEDFLPELLSSLDNISDESIRERIANNNQVRE